MMEFRLAAAAVLGGAVVFAAAHWLWRGRGPRLDGPPRRVRRFGRFVVALHAVLALSFLALVGTGGYAAAVGRRLDGWLLMTHLSAAGAFAASLTALFFAWADACRFGADADDFFLPGQKLLFWLTCAAGLTCAAAGLGCFVPVLTPENQAALLSVHRWAALALCAMGVLHLYFDWLGRGGARMSMVTGRVGEAWAQRRPLWWKQIQKGNDDEAE